VTVAVPTPARPVLYLSRLAGWNAPPPDDAAVGRDTGRRGMGMGPPEAVDFALCVLAARSRR